MFEDNVSPNALLSRMPGEFYSFLFYFFLNYISYYFLSMGTTSGFLLINKSLPVPAITTAGDMKSKGKGWFDEELRC